jgi:hypothetical protein
MRRLLLAIVCCAFVAPLELAACSCISQYPNNPNSSVDWYVDRADLIFIGRVREDLPYKDIHRHVLLEVRETFKGEKADVREVITGFSDADCGYDFQEGEVYLVFANAIGKRFESLSCSGNLPGSAAVQEIRYLRARRRASPSIKTAAKKSAK